LAEELDDFEWGDGRGKGGPGKYDWTRWIKGDIWRIKRGEDYDIPTENMRVTLHAKADQKGLKVRTRKVPLSDDPDHGKWEGLVFQFLSEEDAAEEEVAGQPSG
jgi:hypothetical protein